MTRTFLLSSLIFLVACSSAKSSVKANEKVSKPVTSAVTPEAATETETPKPEPTKAATPKKPLGTYQVNPGEQIGPIYVGMTRSEVEALGVLNAHPNYSAMTLPYTVYYENDIVKDIGLSLSNSKEDVTIGKLSIPASATMEEVITLLGDCGETEMLIGGNISSCRSGKLQVSVGSGDPSEVWLRIAS